MNINSYKATEMIMETLNTFFAHNHNYQIDTCECCISVFSSVSPPVCHTFVSVTYLPNARFDYKINSQNCAPLWMNMQNK